MSLACSARVFVKRIGAEEFIKSRFCWSTQRNVNLEYCAWRTIDFYWALSLIAQSNISITRLKCKKNDSITNYFLSNQHAELKQKACSLSTRSTICLIFISRRQSGEDDRHGHAKCSRLRLQCKHGSRSQAKPSFSHIRFSMPRYARNRNQILLLRRERISPKIPRSRPKI